MLTNKEKIEFLNSLGFTLVSKDLSNNLEVKCEKGHIFKRAFKDFQKGSTKCPHIVKKKKELNF
jgi:hypothetical protein